MDSTMSLDYDNNSSILLDTVEPDGWYKPSEGARLAELDPIKIIFGRTGHMNAFLLALPFAMLLSSCSASHQGIKVRAQSPHMEEAFRKFWIALTTDGYELEVVDPIRHELVTSWRDLEEEEGPDTTGLSGEESRLVVRMERRGGFYDVMVTPLVRSVGGRVVTADFDHPLMEKWQRIVQTLVVKENREGD